jgi:peptide/nickel transport system substrate-binding protein
MIDSSRSRSARVATLAAAAVGIAILLLAAGCGSSSTTGGSEKKELSVGINSSISTLDPALACATQYDYWVVKNAYDTLVQYSDEEKAADGQRKIVPMLAERWTIDNGGRDYTFDLRDDVKFASGNPLTAADVVYGFKRLLAKDGCQAYVMTLGNPKSVQSIEALDRYTVRIRIARKSPTFLGQLTQTGLSPIDRKLLEQHGGLSKEGDDWLARHTAGSGAYTVAEYQPDNRVRLAARSDYWQGKPANTSVTIRIVTDPTSFDTLVRSGGVDMAYGVPLKDIDSLSADRKLFESPGQWFVYLGMNNDKPPFDDVRVRQAINAALDLRGIERLGYGHAEIFAGPMPPAMPFYPDLPVPEQDLAKAKRLMADAGVRNAQVTLDIKTGETLQREIATVIQDTLAEIGIDVKISTLGASAFFDRVATYKSQAYLVRDGAPFNDPAYFLGFLVKCDNPFNWTRYCNDRVDELLVKGQYSTETQARADAYRELSEVVADEAPLIPILAPDSTVIADPGLEGFVAYDDYQPVFWPMRIR